MTKAECQLTWREKVKMKAVECPIQLHLFHSHRWVQVIVHIIIVYSIVSRSNINIFTRLSQDASKEKKSSYVTSFSKDMFPATPSSSGTAATRRSRSPDKSHRLSQRQGSMGSDIASLSRGTTYLLHLPILFVDS
jgi:hypothetical protein